MKKLTALLLAALMVFTMMACAAKETTTETKQPEQTAEEAKTAETTETSGEEAQEAEGLDYRAAHRGRQTDSTYNAANPEILQ